MSNQDIHISEYDWLGPGARFGHASVYHEGSARTVLFGGFGPDGIPLGDTWEWNGDLWRKVTSEGPSPRKWAAMANDAKRNRIILFGGREEVERTGLQQGDTWEWDGKAWRILTSSGPSNRDHHRMVYDCVRDRVILFGGWDGTVVLGDTWEWDGTEWERVALDGPSPRAAHGMAYDETRQAVVLFGGRSLEQFFDDTWLWDGRKWTRVNSDRPRKRAMLAMTYDSDLKRVLLYGGRDGPALLGDTWGWGGKRWEELSTSGPPRRGAYSMAYDRNRQQAVLHGGGHYDGDNWHLHDGTWLWHESVWKQVQA